MGIDREWTDRDIINAFGAGKLYSDTITAEGWLAQLYIGRKLAKEHSEEKIGEKMSQGKEILQSLGIIEPSRYAILMLLALCNIQPGTEWNKATRSSMTMSKDIIKHSIEYYGLKEITNNRDSFRREAVNILLNHSLIDLNPDNQNLGPNSPKTHYTIKEWVLKTIREYEKAMGI